MKPFVWVTALVLALLFLAGAVFTASDALNEVEFFTSPKSKAAAGWLVTGLMFLSLGVRGWRGWRRSVQSDNQRATGRPSN